MGYEKAREIVKENIDYDILLCDSRYSQDRLDEIVELMTEVLSSCKSSMVIAGSEYPMTLVRDRLMQLTSMHIQYVFDCLNQNTTHIRNIKKYLLAALFNAPTTMDSYYAALVNRDSHNSPW